VTTLHDYYQTDFPVGRLERQANHFLDKGPWSVTDKKVIGPGAGIHDYNSMAKYYWPSNTQTGCPYVVRDGESNPEVGAKTSVCVGLLKLLDSFSI
jgi:hypothetical protein